MHMVYYFGTVAFVIVLAYRLRLFYALKRDDKQLTALLDGKRHRLMLEHQRRQREKFLRNLRYDTKDNLT